MSLYHVSCLYIFCSQSWTKTYRHPQAAHNLPSQHLLIGGVGVMGEDGKEVGPLLAALSLISWCQPKLAYFTQ